ncbi:hypothetical protein Tco_1468712 [Tanacetum coccineum]
MESPWGGLWPTSRKRKEEKVYLQSKFLGLLLCVTVVAPPPKLQDSDQGKTSGNVIDEEDVEVTTKGKAVSKVNSTETEQDGDTSFVTPETVKWIGRTSSKMGYYDDLKFMINEEYNGKESSRRGKQCD